MSNVLSEWVKGNCAKAERLGLSALFASGPVFAEEKIKGRRVFAWSVINNNERLGERRVCLATKHNGIYDEETEVKGVKLYKELMAEMKDSIVPGSILDCELWPERYGGGEPTLYVFDALFIGRKDVRACSLSERKLMVKENVKETVHVKILPFQVVRSAEEAAAFKADVVAKGGEGLVLKADVPYGRPGSWVKDKAEETVDCYVDGFGTGAKGERTYFVAVNESGRKDLLLKKVLGEVYSAVVGVDRSEVRIGTVLEVRFGVVNGELIFPGTILRIRDDKKASECFADQWRVEA